MTPALHSKFNSAFRARTTRLTCENDKWVSLALRLGADLSIVLDLDTCKRIDFHYDTLCVSPDKANLERQT
jgi:hypothetical protein